MFELPNRVALVTGAGQGIGAAIAHFLAGCGASMALNDVDPDRAHRVTEELRTAGGRAVAVVADITDEAAVASMVTTIERELGAVDVLVNNAGIPAGGMDLKPFVHSESTDWVPLVQLNVFGVLHCTRRVLPSMIDRSWGRVVTITSDAGRVGEPFQAVYGATKAAAAGFSRSLAKEVGRYGVTSNCVALGSVPAQGAEFDAERRARQLRLYPMRRLGSPDDVAAAVVWLASEEAGWVTGQTISVDGGYATS